MHVTWPACQRQHGIGAILPRVHLLVTHTRLRQQCVSRLSCMPEVSTFKARLACVMTNVSCVQVQPLTDKVAATMVLAFPGLMCAYMAMADPAYEHVFDPQVPLNQSFPDHSVPRGLTSCCTCQVQS